MTTISLCSKTEARVLDDVIGDADVFWACPPGVLRQEMVKKMADQPLILALANPTPEITPEEHMQYALMQFLRLAGRIILTKLITFFVFPTCSAAHLIVGRRQLTMI